MTGVRTGRILRTAGQVALAILASGLIELTLEGRADPVRLAALIGALSAVITTLMNIGDTPASRVAVGDTLDSDRRGG